MSGEPYLQTSYFLPIEGIAQSYQLSAVEIAGNLLSNLLCQNSILLCMCANKFLRT